MSNDFEVERFRDWLAKSADPPCEFVRSWVSGFLLAARGRSLTEDSLEESLQFARESGMDDQSMAAMRTLGGWMMRFQEALALGDLDPPAPAAEDRSGPIANGSGEYILEALLPEESEPGAAPQTADRPSPPGGQAVLERKKNWLPWALGGAGVALAAIGVLWWFSAGASPAPRPAPVAKAKTKTPSAPAAPAAARPGVPSGWQSAAGPSPEFPLLYRGGTAENPEHGIYFEPVLVAGTGRGEPVEKLAKKVEQAVAARIAATGGKYESAGCAPQTLGRATWAVCQGTANEADRSLALRAYVRVDGERALLALSMAKSSVKNAGPEADRVVQAIQP